MRQSTYKRSIVERSRNYFCHGKAINITHSEHVSVSLDTQYTKRMRPIILLSVAFQSQNSFSTLFLKRHDFLKKFMEYKMHVFIFLQL